MPFALALIILLALLAVFQLALVCGAPLGHFAWGGQHRVLPARMRVGSLIAIVIYALIALVSLDRIGAIQVFPNAVAVVAMWVIVAYFALGIAMNAMSKSRSERAVMVPLTIVLTVLSLLIALGFGEMAIAA